MTADISFAVPYYSAPEYLRDALESLRSQTYLNWEAVVVDDIAGVGDTVNISLVNDESGVIYKKKKDLVRFHIPNCSESAKNVDGKWTLTCSTADDDGGYSSDNDDGRKIDAGGAKRRHMKKKYKYNKKTNKKLGRYRKLNKRTNKNKNIKKKLNRKTNKLIFIC